MRCIVVRFDWDGEIGRRRRRRHRLGVASSVAALTIQHRFFFRSRTRPHYSSPLERLVMGSLGVIAWGKQNQSTLKRVSITVFVGGRFNLHASTQTSSQTPKPFDAKANQQNPGLRVELRAEEGGEES
ncbi:hypothetical protein L209DRAFT_100803 [Thermothelomyces heterothallicus CBS 203.75]